MFLDVTGDLNGRCERIRTSDPFVPNEVRYQAAPHTDITARVLYQKRTAEPIARFMRAINPSKYRTSGPGTD